MTFNYKEGKTCLLRPGSFWVDMNSSIQSCAGNDELVRVAGMIKPQSCGAMAVSAPRPRPASCQRRRGRGLRGSRDREVAGDWRMVSSRLYRRYVGGLGGGFPPAILSARGDSLMTAHGKGGCLQEV